MRDFVSLQDLLLLRQRLVFKKVTDAQVLGRSSLLGHVKVGTGQTSDLEVSTPLAALVGTVLRRLKKSRFIVILFVIII